MDIFKILLLAIITIVILIVLKNNKREDVAIAITLLSTVIIFGFIVIKLDGVISLLNNLASNSGIKSDYLVLIIKVMGISYLVEIVKNICQDAGSSSIATKVEMAGKVAIVILTIPIITSVVSIILDLL